MQLLNDIVTLLSDKSGSLTDALLKTKVLMHRIGHKELAEWVNDELNGYPLNKPLPDYRTISVRLYGNVSNIAWRHAATQLPTFHLTKEQRARFSVGELRESIQVLEQYAASDNSLTRPVAPEWYHTLAKGGIQSSFSIEKAWTQFEPNKIVHMLIEVRSRLLDFALNLQGELGDILEENMKEAAKGIDAPGMFAASIHGDNHTFIMGNGNVTSINNTVTKGDVTALAEAFKNSGVSDADVAELQDAVGLDDSDAVAETKQFGPRVKAWMTKMSGKAIDGAWAIGIGAGGKLLADALHSYYGLK